jgi:carboxypeptidase C (cathepsin A)
MMNKTLLAVLLLICISFFNAIGAEPDAAPAKPESPAPSAAPHQFITHHKIQIGSETLSYTAEAGEIQIPDADGAPKASIFSISYVKEGSDAANRPITFLFNGGPGSSAVWLHLGAFGPKRLSLSGDPVNPGSPPYKLVDNQNTLLRYSDLVFVDPVGTGYSHAMGKSKDSDYWGVDEDSASIAQFIRLYLSKHNRWNSPKFLAGESYGTTRASVLVRDLELALLDGVALNGVILISTALDVRTFVGAGPQNELPYVTNLPTYAATAYYHKVLPDPPGDLDQFLKDAQKFAETEYLEALFLGDSLPKAQADEIVNQLHHYTGLSKEFLIRAHLRIDTNRFLKELLRDRGQTLAIHDTRFLGKDPDEAGEAVQFDPFLFGIAGPFVATINSYLAGDLDVKMTETYKTFSLEANQSWKRSGDSNRAFDGYLYTANYLTQAAATNRDFRIFVASGLHDLTTTFFGTEYIFDHAGIDKSRITLKNYFGGHMMYLYDPSLQQLSSDIGAFIKGS